jgi:hypothetical protein
LELSYIYMDSSDQIPWIRSRSHISPPRMQSRRLLSLASIARRPANELCAVALNLDFAALHAARSPPLEWGARVVTKLRRFGVPHVFLAGGTAVSRDAADAVLARHFGLHESELGYIVLQQQPSQFSMRQLAERALLAQAQALGYLPPPPPLPSPSPPATVTLAPSTDESLDALPPPPSKIVSKRPRSIAPPPPPQFQVAHYCIGGDSLPGTMRVSLCCDDYCIICIILIARSKISCFEFAMQIRIQTTRRGALYSSVRPMSLSALPNQPATHHLSIFKASKLLSTPSLARTTTRSLRRASHRAGAQRCDCIT